MALEAGVMSITVEYAKNLKSGDWFGKQDPYCILRVGCQEFRTHTAKKGGRNPVWHETFQIALMNENDVNMDVKDEDVGRDDLLGSASFSLARAREKGSDRQEVAVFSNKSRKQHGYVLVTLKWASHRVPGGGTQVRTQIQQQPHPQPQWQPQLHWGAIQYGMPPQQQQLLPSAPPVAAAVEAAYYTTAAGVAGSAAATPVSNGGYHLCAPHLGRLVPTSAVYQPSVVAPSVYYHQ